MVDTVAMDKNDTSKMTDPITIPGYEKEIELIKWLKPYVRQCGAERRDRWHNNNRKLLDYLVVYIKEGYGKFIINGVPYSAKAHDLFWIPPDTVHSMNGFSNYMVCPFIHFDLIYRYPESHWDFSIPEGMTDLGELRHLMHPEIPESDLNELCGRYRLFNNRRIGVLIEELVKEAAQAQPYYMLRISGSLMGVISEFLRGLRGERNVGSKLLPRLEKAYYYMNKNYSQQLSIDRLSYKFGFSESYFRKLFKNYYGISPHRYLRQVRINNAKTEMIHSRQSISDVAASCGFRTVHSFSKAFKQVEGISPQQYRRFGKGRIMVSGRPPAYPSYMYLEDAEVPKRH